MPPEISVIVPVYKVEAYLARCVDSIIAQTFVDFELILVDDGSPDSCGAICDAYAARDNRIRIIHQPNAGLSAARNAGIELALKSPSKYISFVDSDDYVAPLYLETLLAGVKTGARVSCCTFVRVPPEPAGDDNAVCGFSLLTPRDYYLQRNLCPMIAWAKLYDKSLFADIRYPAGRIHEDEWITYRILFACEKIAFSPAPLYRYFQRADSIMGKGFTAERLSVIEPLQAQLAFFKAHGEDELFRQVSRELAGYVALAILLLKRKDLRKLLRKLIEDCPSLRGTRGFYILAHPVKTLPSRAIGFIRRKLAI